MKKLILSIFVCVAFATASYAQLAARAGVNLANISAETMGITVDYGSKLGFQAGVTYKTMLNETIAFRPGVLFSLKGAKLDLEILGEEFETSTNFTYVEVPLDLVYSVGSIDLHAGPYLGLLMSANTKSGDEDSVDVKDETNTLDFGLNIGGQYMINDMMGVGVNYGLGFANLAKDAPDDSSAKNKNLAFYLTYAF